jgi:hypothetical protein
MAKTPPPNISLRLRFDGDAKAVQNVLFRVMPEAWPTAVTAVLPLVHVDVKSASSGLAGPPSMPVQQHINGGERSDDQTTREKEEKEGGAVTWDDLKREGALLGIQGWTDRSKL